MKKVVVVISILLLLFCHFSAVCEEIDLSTLSDEQLTELSNRVSQEMFDRGIVFEEVFPFGEYVVGKDIRAGKYTILVTDTDPNGIRVGPSILLYSSELDYGNDERNQYASFRSDGSLYVELNDGMVIVIREGYGSVNITNRKSSFAP